MNGCYKGIRPGEICGNHHHQDGCPETMTPEQRADAFINANNAGLALWSPCMFRRRLIETIQAAQEQGKKMGGEPEEPNCTCRPAGPGHDHSDDCELEKWRKERRNA